METYLCTNRQEREDGAAVGERVMDAADVGLGRESESKKLPWKLSYVLNVLKRHVKAWPAVTDWLNTAVYKNKKSDQMHLLPPVRVSSGGVSRATPPTHVLARKTVWSTERAETAANTAVCRNAWLWACPEMVRHTLSAHTGTNIWQLNENTHTHTQKHLMISFGK